MFQAVLGHPHDDLVDGRSHEKLAAASSFRRTLSSHSC